LNYAENLRLRIKATLYDNGRTIEGLACTANRGMQTAAKNQGNLLIVKWFARIRVPLESRWGCG
jgi:hypothetical protein